MEMIIEQNITVKENNKVLRKYEIGKSIKHFILLRKGDYFRDTFYIKSEHLANSYLVDKVELEYDTEECYVTLERISIDINENLTLDVIDNIINKAREFQWSIVK